MSALLKRALESERHRIRAKLSEVTGFLRENRSGVTYEREMDVLITRHANSHVKQIQDWLAELEEVNKRIQEAEAAMRPPADARAVAEGL